MKEQVLKIQKNNLEHQIKDFINQLITILYQQNLLPEISFVKEIKRISIYKDINNQLQLKEWSFFDTFHKDLNIDWFRWFVIYLENNKKILFLKEIEFNLKKYWISLDTLQSYFDYILLDNFLNNLPNTIKDHILNIMSNIDKLNLQIYNLIKKQQQQLWKTLDLK